MKGTGAQSGRFWFWPCIPALMILTSVCLLTIAGAPFFASSTWLGVRHAHALRQGVAGGIACVLAWCFARFSVHRLLLRHWTAFPGMMLALVVLAPLSIWMDFGIMIYGTGWWQRTIGQIVFLLALIFSAGAAIPRFVNRERHGLLLLAGVVLLTVAAPLGFLKSGGMVFVGAGALALIFLAALPPKQLALVLPAYGFCVLSALLMTMSLSSSMDGWMSRLASVLEGESNFQLQQSLVSINAGGLFGNTDHPTWIPEWHHDFMFARFCGAVGLFGGLLGLLLLGIMLAVVWRIAVRQTDLRNRVVAAGCAAVLTVQAFLHIGVNLGLFPTMGSHFPFFSYGPKHIVFDGFLVGLLLALDRKEIEASTTDQDQAGETSSSGVDAAAPVPSCCAQSVVVGGVWVVLAIFAIRLGVLVFNSPDLREAHLASVWRAEAREEKRNKPVCGRIIDSKGGVLVQTGRMHKE